MLYYYTPPARRLSLSLALTVSTALPALADVPRVVTDIPPIQSLVAQVMQGVGTPDVIVPASASPHGYSMRPSQAAALDSADVVFWMGHELTPWLERSLDVLADQATVIALLDTDGTNTLTFRDTKALAGAEKHDEQNDHDDHSDQDEHADHEEDHDDHEEHADHSDEHEHDHDGIDPHAWLDPENAKVWLRLIADQLAVLDAENAATYTQNANASIAKINTMSADIKAQLAPVASSNFVVFHDAYQYFETAFGLSVVGSIAISDASQPSPARVSEVKSSLAAQNVSCVFTEPQFDQGLVDVVIEGSDVKSAVLDPLGAKVAQGPMLYTLVLENLATQMADCLSK